MDVDLTSSESSDPTDAMTSELLQKFSCLNTNDRDELVKQFKLLLGEKCFDSTAEFWLDMNNWNLQAAVCSYFDYESTSPNYMLKLPSIQIVIPDTNTNEYLPNSSFTYSFTVTNSGDEPWPHGCTLRYCSGQQLSKEERFLLSQLNPGQSCQMNLQFTTPDKAGLYFSQWRFSTITGQFFGETIFIIVNVLDDLNQVTKQLSAAHIDHIQQVPENSCPPPLHQMQSIMSPTSPITTSGPFQQQQKDLSLSQMLQLPSNDNKFQNNCLQQQEESLAHMVKGLQQNVMKNMNCEQIIIDNNNSNNSNNAGTLSAMSSATNDDDNSMS